MSGWPLYRDDRRAAEVRRELAYLLAEIDRAVEDGTGCGVARDVFLSAHLKNLDLVASEARREQRRDRIQQVLATGESEQHAAADPNLDARPVTLD